MNNPKKWVGWLLVNLLVVGLLAACSDNTATVTLAPNTAVSTTVAIATTPAVASTTASTTVTTVRAANTSATNTTLVATTTAPTAAAVPAPTITPLAAVAQTAGSVKVTMWYALGGLLGNEFLQRVNQYNQSQSKYYIEAIFQSSYEDVLNKVNTNLAGGSLPDLVQIYEIGTQRMIDSKRFVPIQDLIERDKLQDVLADFEEAFRDYYAVNGKLYSMPFNTSTPVTYFDKKAFREAGLDAEKKVWTYDELLDAARKTTKKDAAGKVIRTGIALDATPWYVEQAQALHSGFFAEPENGRTGRATKYSFNNDNSVKWFDFMKKALDEGAATYYGVTGASAVSAAFVNGSAAIHFQSIANLRTYITSAERAGNKIEVGVAFVPRRGDSTGRTTIGGASFWISNQSSKERQEGAWDFLKFLIKPEVQASFAASTGYLPVRKSAYNLPDMKEALQKYPQFQVAIDQLRTAPSNSSTVGPLGGTLLPAREEIRKAIDLYLSGKAGSAKTALDDAVKKSNEQLEEYNLTVK